MNVLIKPSAVEELSAVPKEHRRHLVRRLEALGVEPRPPGHEQLSGRNKYRIRPGKYRVVYQIDDAAGEVTVFRLSHRTRHIRHAS